MGVGGVGIQVGTRNVEDGGRASGIQDGTMVGGAMEHW